MRDKFALPTDLPSNTFDDGQTVTVIDSFYSMRPAFVAQQTERAAVMEERFNASIIEDMPIGKAI